MTDTLATASLQHSMGRQTTRAIFTRVISGLCLLIALTSCSNDTVHHAMTDYQTRLGRVLNVQPEALTSPAPLTSMPRQRDRQLPLKDTRFSFWDFVTLDYCPLDRLLAERNNQLGQHMAAPTALIYETEVRQATITCLAIESSETRRLALIELQSAKHASRLTDYWNQTLGHRWFEHFGSTSTQPLRMSDTETPGAATQTLDELSSYLNATLFHSRSEAPLPDSDALIASFQRLETSQALGQTLVSMHHITHPLNQITAMLNRVNPATFCPNGPKHPRVGFLQNVAIRVFGGQLQPHLAVLSSDGGQLLQTTDRLIQQFNTLAATTGQTQAIAGLNHWWQGAYTDETSIYAAYNKAIKQHVAALQRLLDTCGRPPTPDTNQRLLEDNAHTSIHTSSYLPFYQHSSHG